MAVDEECEHETQCATMGGKTFISCEFPRAIGNLVDGQQHLYDMVDTAEEIVWLVEEAVTQACTDEYSQETIDEQRVEELVFYFCFFIKFFYYYIISVSIDFSVRC